MSDNPDTTRKGPSREELKPDGFSKPCCAECGYALENQPATYNPTHRIYCHECRAIGTLKENWKPMTGGSIAGVYTLDASGKVIPRRR